MVSVNYPDPDFRIKKQDGKDCLFDPLRKKWILLTPEEWVRQNFVQYLIRVKKYPETMIGIEKQILLGEMKKRFDILIYDKTHQPWMMIECKEMNVPLDETVLDQLLRYNISIPVQYLVITNGKQCLAWRRSHSELVSLSELPSYSECS